MSNNFKTIRSALGLWAFEAECAGAWLLPCRTHLEVGSLPPPSRPPRTGQGPLVEPSPAQDQHQGLCRLGEAGRKDASVLTILSFQPLALGPTPTISSSRVVPGPPQSNKDPSVAEYLCLESLSYIYWVRNYGDVKKARTSASGGAPPSTDAGLDDLHSSSASHSLMMQ